MKKLIKSMTSFGRAQSEEGKEHLFSIEMKSVNNRYLDLNIRMPKFMISLEEEIRKIINTRLNRGKVDVFINLKSYNEGSGIPKLDINLAQEYLKCLKEIENNLDVKNDISVMQIARFPEVITMVEEEDKVIYTLDDDKEEFTVRKDGDTFVVEGKAVNRLMGRINIDDNESMYYFQKKLKELGIEDELKRQGICEDDYVKMLNWTFEWYQ